VPARWIAAGVALHAVAAGLFLASALSTDAVRTRNAGRNAAALELAPEAPGVAVTGSASHATPLAPARVPAAEVQAEIELEGRVQAATSALVATLATDEYEEARWLAETRALAEALGDEARPMLEAVLADPERPVEEHVAASELLAALR
jgi:hypothetical protein